MAKKRKYFKLNPVLEKLLDITWSAPYPKRNLLGKRICRDSDKDKIRAAQDKRAMRAAKRAKTLEQQNATA